MIFPQNMDSDPTALDTHLRNRIKKDAQFLASKDSEIEGDAWIDRLHKHAKDYVLLDVLRVSFDHAIELVRRIKPLPSGRTHKGDFERMCDALFKQDLEARASAQRLLDDMVKELHNHG